VLVIWAATPIWHEIRQVVGELPSYIEDLKDEPLFDQLHENTDVADKAEGLARDAVKKIPEVASALLGITGGLLSVVTLVFLTLFLLIGLPDFKRAGLSMLPLAQAARTERVLDEVTETISYSLLGNVAISVIAGSVVGVTALIVGAPFPIVLALIVGLFDLIPQVGSPHSSGDSRGDHPRCIGRGRGSGHGYRDPGLPADRELPDPAAGLSQSGRAVGLCDDRRRAGRRCLAGRDRGDPRRPGRRLAEGRRPRADLSAA
jgi:hypothetical protein